VITNYLEPHEEANPKLRRCYDCVYMRGAVSWWCTNKAAIEYRGTRIPGISHCNFWSPASHSPLVQLKRKVVAAPWAWVEIVFWAASIVSAAYVVWRYW